MFPDQILKIATDLVAAARGRGLRLGTVETVTAGLVSAAITSAPGASQVFERGFVLYGDDAKSGGLDIAPEIAASHGAVSAEITAALARAFFAHGAADVSLAVTGYAGPGGGSADKPVGSVFLAAARRNGTLVAERALFQGDRNAVRLQAVEVGLVLLSRIITG